MSTPKHGVALIGVEAAPGLTTKVTGGDHPAQERRSSVSRVIGHRVECLAQPDLGVEANEVEELAGPHGVAHPLLEGGVDLRWFGHPRLHKANGVIVERDDEVVED